jgi:hypothetical protein
MHHDHGYHHGHHGHHAFHERWNPRGQELDDHDEFLGDDLGNSIMGGFYGGHFRHQRLGGYRSYGRHGMMGRSYGGMGYRSYNDAYFPDRTMFITIVSVLSFVALLLLGGLIALGCYVKRQPKKYTIVE